MSIQAPMSWVEQFMNWYPRHTKLYRRRSKHDSPNAVTQMSIEFDELKPFFKAMADTIWNKAKTEELNNTHALCQAILQCRTIGEAQAMAQQAVMRFVTDKEDTDAST